MLIKIYLEMSMKWSEKDLKTNLMSNKIILEALNEQEEHIIRSNVHIKDLLLDNESKISDEMVKLFIFSLKVKKYKQK